MTYDTLIDLLTHSEPEDWLRSSPDIMFTLKTDLNVTIHPRDLMEEHNYLDEPWATGLGHERVSIRVYELWYGMSFVREFYFASVDGGRAHLPYPKALDDLRITTLQFAIGLAVNSHTGNFHEYLRRAQIHVIHGPVED